LADRGSRWTTKREAKAWTILGLALSLSLLLAWKSTAFARVTDNDIAASAPEDVLGFGFALEWAPLTLLEVLLLVGGYRIGEARAFRIAAMLGLVAYVITSISAWMQYTLLAHRVLG
jgi:hypothetical protein